MQVADDIRMLIDRSGQLWTASAISYELHRGAGGILGEEPADEVAEALAALVASDDLVRVDVCAVCETRAEFYAPTSAGQASDESRGRGLTAEEQIEVISPLVGEGLVELSETIEFIDSGCCCRTTRDWRPTPRPC